MSQPQPADQTDYAGRHRAPLTADVASSEARALLGGDDYVGRHRREPGSGVPSLVETLRRAWS